MYKNKIILITGASSGLGKNLAFKYANEKGKIINLSRNPIKIKNLNEKLKKINNIDNIGYSVDVSNYDDILNVKNKLLRENNIPDINPQIIE